jgi:hypothetical protein
LAKKDRSSYEWRCASSDELDFLFSSQVAIKIISKKNAPPEYLQKFMPREIDALNATCRHRNVVSAFSLPFIVHLALGKTVKTW